MEEISMEIAMLSKSIPETARGFGVMGAAAKTSGALDEKNQRGNGFGNCRCHKVR